MPYTRQEVLCFPTANKFRWNERKSGEWLSAWGRERRVDAAQLIDQPTQGAERRRASGALRAPRAARARRQRGAGVYPRPRSRSARATARERDSSAVRRRSRCGLASSSIELQRWLARPPHSILLLRRIPGSYWLMQADREAETVESTFGVVSA